MTMMIPMPPELLTAEERFGFRLACAKMRLHGARIERSGALIGDTDTSLVPRGELMRQCGRMAQTVADLTEAALDYAPGARPTLPGPAD